MFKTAHAEEVDKYAAGLLYGIAFASRTHDTVDAVSGLPVFCTFRYFKGERVVAISHGEGGEAALLRASFLKELLHLCRRGSMASRTGDADGAPRNMFARNGSSSGVICAGFSRREGQDLVRITVSASEATIYMEPAFLLEVVKLLDA